MKITLVFTLVISLFALKLCAQPIVEAKGNTIDIAIFIPGPEESKYDKIEGSPYLHDEFLPASVNDLKKTQLIRFNTVDHYIEAKTEKGIMRLNLTHNLSIKLLDGSNKQFIAGRFIDKNGKEIKTFFEPFEAVSEHQLFKRQRKKFIEEKKVLGYQDAQPAKFIAISDAFFISDYKSKSDHLLEIPRTKKKFYAFFGKDAKNIAAFVKKEKLDISAEEDLIKIFENYFSDIN